MPIKSEEQVYAAKVVFGMLNLPPLIRSALLRRLVLLFALMSGSPAWAQEAAADREIEDVTILAPFQVKGVRMEDFGVRFNGTIAITGPDSLMISEVFPNTAAAKAGLKPGELIDKIDGKSVSMMTIFSMVTKPQKLQQRKWAELEAGKKSVTLSLEVRTPGAKQSRTVALVIPSPAPHWGDEKWSAPEGRIPAVVNEPGPLAALAREVLDNGIWSGAYDNTGYGWRIVQTTGSHRIWVTQKNGKTEITLEHRSPETGRCGFSTSPSGAMERGWCTPPKKQKRKEIPPEELRPLFEAEIAFWLTKVGRVTGRWPFEALTGKTEVIGSTASALVESGKVNAPLAESFLKLPVATAAQKELFFAALGKIGRDGACWAFTETSRSLEDDHVTTVRYDPSKPPEESSTLLKVDGKAPKAAYLEQWRNEGHSVLTGLGELPALSSVVDVNDIRIYADETAAVVFELPVKASNEEFKADKFQARFRVNKTHGGFEDFSVKLREPMRVAGIAKVTDAGLEARFQKFDPSLAPQPVLLKMGGGVRVLFVKFSRSFEVTRTDFKRVVPFEEPVKPAR